jgi:CBS domain-containing protein
MRAVDVMTTTVLSVTPEMTVRDAAKMMVEQRISAVPVIDAKGQLIGMVSEGDLMRRVELGTEKRQRSWWLDLLATGLDADEYVKSHGHLVEDIMTRDVIFVDEATPLNEIAGLLESKHIKRVPVLRQGELVGIVSRANLVQALASAHEEAPPEIDPTDREIRAALLGEITGRPWAFAGRNIIVRDGVVHLWGVFRSPEAVKAVRVAAEGIPGVKGVEDHTESFPVNVTI